MPIILAFLAKDWKYLVIIAALTGAVGWIYHRGELHVKAADAKVVAAQIVHTREVQDEIKAKVASAIAEYDALSPIPVPAVVSHLVCHPAGSGGVPKGGPSSGGNHPAGAGVPASAAAANEGFDPAPAVSATGIAADAEIDHLQKKIKLLQDYVAVLQAGGLIAR